MAIIKNRRENILINEQPPEIPSVEGIEEAVEKVTDGKLLPNGGSAGNVLKKTADGAEWGTVSVLPDGGNVGNVLKKTADGAEWGTTSIPPATDVSLGGVLHVTRDDALLQYGDTNAIYAILEAAGILTINSTED